MLVWINIWWYFLYGEKLFSSDLKNKDYIICGLFLIEFLIIQLYIKKLYSDPIWEMKLLIQKFYVGDLKWKEIELKKSQNPNVNYIMEFFWKTLNTLKNIKDEFMHGKEIKWEVEIGKEIQWKMLSKKLITIPSLEVVAKSRPAWEIGWDSYDIMQQWDNYYIYVWDATGHWVWAWFIMIMVNALMSGFAKLFVSGAQILANTNEVLKPRVKANLLMSLLLVRWNEKNKTLFMTWAGHEYLMIYKQRLWKCFRVKSWWVALGMIKNIHKLVKEQQIQFEPEDVLVLYSDGITEAINRPSKDGSEEMYGEDRLQAAIESAPNVEGKKYKSARWIFNHLTIEQSRFMWYKHAQYDDITLCTVQYKSEDYHPENDISLEISPDMITEWKW